MLKDIELTWLRGAFEYSIPVMTIINLALILDITSNVFVLSDANINAIRVLANLERSQQLLATI